MTDMAHSGTRNRVRAAKRPVGDPVGARQESCLLNPRSLREASRLAGLQTELRLMGSLASEQAVQGLTPYLAVDPGALKPATLIRSQRDARFQLEPSQLEQVLNHFDADLEKAETSPKMLIVVAHQDDETIGAGTQLARLQDATVLHVTDGSPRNAAYAQRFGYSTASEYGEVRRREAAEALKLAGIPEERQLCFGIPDGEASYQLVDLSLKLAELLDELRPDVVLTHPYEGGHTDHDAIAFAVHLACGMLRREGTPPPVVLELTSYHNANGARVVHDFLPSTTVLPIRTLRLSRRAMELKSRMYECFRTQQKCLDQFRVDVERFRPAPRYIFTRPPHEGQLDYERLTTRLSYDSWRAQAQRALATLRTDRRASVALQVDIIAEPCVTELPPAGAITVEAATSIPEPQDAEPFVAAGSIGSMDEAGSPEFITTAAGADLGAEALVQTA